MDTERKPARLNIIQNCFVKMREGDDDFLLGVRMNGYTIVPLEEYMSLTPRKSRKLRVLVKAAKSASKRGSDD